MAIRVLVLAGVVGLLIATPGAREQPPVSTVRQWEYVIVTQLGSDVSVCYAEPAGCRMETLRWQRPVVPPEKGVSRAPDPDTHKYPLAVAFAKLGTDGWELAWVDRLDLGNATFYFRRPLGRG
jgi:hypothetical protein